MILKTNLILAKFCIIAFLLFIKVVPLCYAQKETIRLHALDEQRINQISLSLNDIPRGLGEPATDRKRWDDLRQSGKYDKFLKEIRRYSFPAFNKADYFSLSDGTASSSTQGLNMMRNRAKGLSMLTIAECLENNGEFVKAVENGLKEILEQKSWVSPRVDYSFINYNGKQYTIDLTSALYAHTIAQTLYLLDGKIDKNLKAEAVAALYKRVFDPMLTIFNKQNAKYHSWLVGTNNWNAVCLSGVVGAALTVINDKKERAIFAYIGEEYSKNFLAGFEDDGYCSEGLTYFNYGFSHYSLLRENLRIATNGSIDLFKNSKVLSIATYVPRILVSNGIFPAISDTKVGTRPDPLLMHYLSLTLQLGLSEYENMDVTGRTENNRLDVLVLFTITPLVESKGARRINQGESSLRSFFDKSGILVVRSSSVNALSAVLKGGNNAENHNHNDVGSYTIVLGKEILAGDPGSIPYSADIFKSESRYKYKSISSYGHPVPLPAGTQQSVGRDASAKIVQSKFSKEKDVLVFDLKSAYPVPGMSKLTRSFIYDRTQNSSLEVEDVFEYATPMEFETALISRATIKKHTNDQWIFDSNGQKLVVSVSCGDMPYETSLETITEGGMPYKRMAIRLKNKTKSGKIVVTYSPFQPN